VLSSGTKLGAYEISGALGAGGMGEVYRARDSRLNRDVALKVLPEAFARDAERMARLRREAQMLASLNHPNIAAIYGFEDSGATHALVMELVEGPTLAEKISGAPNASGAANADLKVATTRGHRNGAIAVDEVLPIAKQIADALEYAHERGIIHRDLKPGNIKITNADAVKILDFGLAKAIEGDAASMDISSSPTISRMATQAGVILGTAAYMSPEQAKGKPVDRRTDIWAFGCVLFEMLTGQMAFSGETVTDTLAAILKSEPDWSQLPSATPAHVRVLLQRCLQKDPRQRLRDIGDARVSLEEVLAGASESYSTAGISLPAARKIIPWALGGLIGGALIAGLAVWKFAPNSASSAAMHFSAVTNFAGVQAQPALSPDGRSVAFVSNRDGHYNIYVGLTGGGSLVQVTNDANLKSRPAWSPDGATLAYARLNHSGLWDIWEVPALGGTPRRVILNATDPAWSPDGHSLAYENLSDRGIWVSGSSGENPRRVAVPIYATENVRNTEPRFSPDGREIVFSVRADGPYGELEVVDLDSGKVRELTHEHALELSPAWSPDGRYIYFCSSGGGTMNIWKIPVNGGDSEQITAGQGDDAELDVSTDGKRIVFSTWRTNTNIARLDLGAKPGQQDVKLLTTDPARNQLAPAYSLNGKYLAYFSNLKGAENESIWVSSADGANPVQLVRDSQVNIFPQWSPDSQRIIYRSMSVLAEHAANEYRAVSVSGGVPQAIFNKAVGNYFDVGSDGRLLFLNSENQPESFDLSDDKTKILGSALPGVGGSPRWASDSHSVLYVVAAKQEDDPNAGLWVDDFKNPPRQIFRGWVDRWVARGPNNEIYFFEGKPDLTEVLCKVNLDGKALTRTPVIIPMVHSYWDDPVQDSLDTFDVSPDGRYLAFEKQTVLGANIGMITNVR
jgi:eukaryotic-like serine/threonine-protein kinase